MLCVYLIILFVPQFVKNANILFVTSFPSVSHQSVFRPVWKELSLRGHQVTAIVSKPLNDKNLKNLTEIDVSPVYEQLVQNVPKNRVTYFLEKPGFLQVFLKDVILTTYFSKMHDQILELPEVNHLIHGNKKFDVVIVEWLFPTMSAFATKFNCPLIGITSLGAPIPALDSVGNPTHPIYYPDHNLPVDRELSFKDRLLSVLYSAYVRIHYHLVILPREDRTIKKHFGENMPYIGDMEKNITLLLLNRNPVFHKIVPVVPSVIELGGLRSIKAGPPLNTELNNFLDNSKDSVIYFSLGSAFLSSYLNEEILGKIIQTFAELPYDVVWKWEEDELPGKPKNVFIQKWVPQISLLRHPKVKLFITQGGLQSMEEAIDNGVPIIGIPTHSDQTMNVDAAVKNGFGLAIDLQEICVSDMKSAIYEIINNASYKKNIDKMKEVMVDRPFDSLDRAIWWIEYVIRHKGARHLRSPLLDIPWYQSLFLDIISFFILITVLVMYTSLKIVRFICQISKKKLEKKKVE